MVKVIRDLSRELVSPDKVTSANLPCKIFLNGKNVTIGLRVAEVSREINGSQLKII